MPLLKKRINFYVNRYPNFSLYIGIKTLLVIPKYFFFKFRPWNHSNKVFSLKMDQLSILIVQTAIQNCVK